ncbi:MAG: hypothetical protein F4181_01860, partial [Proteobacteria bacterium]|nr:hypothetical protein [Pseudomonadota bacterium]
MHTNADRYVLIVVLAVAGGCGGGGSGTSGPGAQPGGVVTGPVAQTLPEDALAISFPLAHAAYNSSSVTVSGYLNHSEFAEMSVTVATGTTQESADIDGRGHFVVPDVPLTTQGANAIIEVTATHPDRGSTRRSLALSRQPDLALIVDMQLDASRGRVVAIDRDTASVVSIDLADGWREMLSGAFVGSGVPLFQPVSLALDATRNRAYVVDEAQSAVLEIDLANGERSKLMESLRRARVAFDPVDRTVVVADRESQNFTLTRIDPVTGVQTQVSGPGMGAIAHLPRVTVFDLDLTFNRAIIADGSSLEGYGIDLNTGRATRLLGRTFRPAPFPVYYDDLAMHNGTAYIVNSRIPTVVSITLSNGYHSMVSNPGTYPSQGPPLGTGPTLYGPRAVALDEANERLIVADNHLGSVFGVETGTGNRTLLADQGVGDGVHLRSAAGLAVSTDPFRLFAAGHRVAMGVEFDLATGDRQLLFGESDPAGTAAPAAVALAVDVQETVAYYAVGDSRAGRLFAIDFSGEIPTVVSGAERGTGPPLGVIVDIELDLARRTAYVLDADEAALLAVDLDTGDRRIVSDSIVGVGERMGFPVAMALDMENDRAFVSIVDNASIDEIYIATGDRAVIASRDVGSGASIDAVGD